MPTDEDLKGYDDAEIRDIINEHHRRRIGKLIAQIKRERSRILNDEFSNGGNQVQQTVFYSGPKLSAVEMEQVQLEKLKRRHQREVEQMIATLVALDTIQKDNERREMMEAERRRQIEDERRRKRDEMHQRHMERLRAMEQEEQRKLKEEAEIRRRQYEREMAALKRQQEEAERKLREAREAERLRQERAELNRQHLQAIEDQRQARIMAQQRKVEEREVRRLQKLREEQERIQKEHEEQIRKRMNQIAAAKQHEIDLLERKRREGEERDRKYEEQRQEFERRRAEETRKYKEMQEEKVRRNGEARIRLAEEALRKRREKATTDAEIEERLKRREEMNRKRSEDAITGRGEIQQAAARRNQQWKLKESQRAEDLRRNQAKSEAHMQMVLQMKEHERKKIQIQRKLREEEKVESAHRLDRQRQRRLDNLKEKMDNTMARVENIQNEKKQMHMERQVMLSQLEREKDRMNSSIHEALVHNRTDPKSIQRLAEMYGIDIAAIQQKAQKRTMSTRRSDNVFITNNGNGGYRTPGRNPNASYNAKSNTTQSNAPNPNTIRRTSRNSFNNGETRSKNNPSNNGGTRPLNNS